MSISLQARVGAPPRTLLNPSDVTQMMQMRHILRRNVRLYLVMLLEQSFPDFTNRDGAPLSPLCTPCQELKASPFQGIMSNHAQWKLTSPKWLSLPTITCALLGVAISRGAHTVICAHPAWNAWNFPKVFKACNPFNIQTQCAHPRL